MQGTQRSSNQAPQNPNSSLRQLAAQEALQPYPPKAPPSPLVFVAHSISNVPVIDVTGAGTTEPEYPSSRTIVWEQSTLTQAFTVSLSSPALVLNERNVSVT